jgi:hypothetical protein
MDVRCVVACRNAAGEPDFFGCVVRCTRRQYEEGGHYEQAEAMARRQGYEGRMLAYDEEDGPDWLFAHLFEAEKAGQARRAAAEVVEYLWDPEVRSAREYHRENGTLEGHVFAALVALENWANGSDRRPEDYIEP